MKWVSDGSFSMIDAIIYCCCFLLTCDEKKHSDDTPHLVTTSQYHSLTMSIERVTPVRLGE